MSDDYDGLTPEAELELRRLRAADRQARLNASGTAFIKGLYREHVRQRGTGNHQGKPGRPAWTRQLFWERYEEAITATPEPRTAAAIAERFRARDGAVGIEPDSLARLRRRAERGKLPE